MNILLVEDDDDKRRKLRQFLEERRTNVVVTERRSFHSGLMEVLSGERYDLVVLDMSMPNFDVAPHEPEGGTPESFAGLDLLAQMRLRGVSFPAVVVTQFDSFGKGEGRLSLDELKRKLAYYSPTYIGTVYYNAAVDEWKGQFEELLTKRGILK